AKPSEERELSDPPLTNLRKLHWKVHLLQSRQHKRKPLGQLFVVNITKEVLGKLKTRKMEMI
uniref:Uncharacterized protein n=1 Tax=Megaselia scalaris TaxID=36166 RepID=T1GH85_MEGSC